ncbi:MAG: hypothetical protein RL732_438 [Bacteroidota bacterium]|jgi:glutathione peroxidase
MVWIKKSAFVLFVLFLVFGGYIALAQQSNHNMTIRQKILKTIYPFMMWMSKSSTNSRIVSHDPINPSAAFYVLPATSIDGEVLSLEQLCRGKMVLVVNTASDCGYTGQYEELQQLYEKYADKLVILGVPSNDFKNQEKEDNGTIETFCRKNYGVTFPLLEKARVRKGAGQQEVFQWLSDPSRNGWNTQAPQWNFSKYLLDDQGRLTHYFGPAVSPSKIEPLLH